MPFFELTDIEKSYTNGDPVFRGINISLEKGKVLGIIGKSGCGKSTLLRIIAGFLKPSKGKIYIEGEKNGNNDCRNVLIFQEDTCFPWLTVGQNLIYSNPRAVYKHDKIAQKYLCDVGLSAEADKYPHALSYGMRKRLEIARAVYSNPDLLLADEPFTGLDAITREKIYDFFIKQIRHRNITTLLVTHNIEEAILLCDEIVVFTPTSHNQNTHLTFFKVDFIPRERKYNSIYSDKFQKMRNDIHETIKE